MKLIDFDQKFADYAHEYVHQGLLRHEKPEVLEAELPELYIRWINAPADWLGGRSPAGYFTQFDAPEPLIELLCQYDREEISPPDLLLERISDLGEASVAPLMALVANQDNSESLRVMALNLLIELQTDAPLALCVDLVERREEEDALADVAAELLQSLGASIAQPLLERLDAASDAALPTFLDLLCNFPGDERIYNKTVSQFLTRDDKRALYASYLAKLGDERAVEPLNRALSLSDLGYLDYIEIRNAVEALGGEPAVPDRCFDGDPHYESLKHME